jgi:3-deoxy-D-manno-octulosonate 8-phosphate phosphatase KdsC-like HAD superfamily phosphatase
MVNFRKLTEKAREVVDKRGGTGALREDMEELGGIAKGKGSLKDKA